MFFEDFGAPKKGFTLAQRPRYERCKNLLEGLLNTNDPQRSFKHVFNNMFKPSFFADSWECRRFHVDLETGEFQIVSLSSSFLVGFLQHASCPGTRGSHLLSVQAEN